MEADGVIFVDSKRTGGLDRIHVCPQKQELPSIFLRLFFHHLFDLSIIISPACIFQAVCCDDNDGFFRHIFFPGIFMYVMDMMDRSSDRIEQCRASSNPVIFFVCRFRNALYPPIVSSSRPPMDPLRSIMKMISVRFFFMCLSSLTATL